MLRNKISKRLWGLFPKRSRVKRFLALLFLGLLVFGAGDLTAQDAVSSGPGFEVRFGGDEEGNLDVNIAIQLLLLMTLLSVGG